MHELSMYTTDGEFQKDFNELRKITHYKLMNTPGIAKVSKILGVILNEGSSYIYWRSTQKDIQADFAKKKYESAMMELKNLVEEYYKGV